MKSLYCLSIAPSFPLEDAWNSLESGGIEILYGSEEEGQALLYAHLDSPSSIDCFTWVVSCTPYVLPTIDWEAQWAAHGQDFYDGYVHVDLAPFKSTAPTLKLKPGPGFGDLSHPTTRLTLHLLGHQLENQTVIDIGCGSGILTIAAAALGASKAYGIDIDPEALEHSRENALLNHLDKICHFYLPLDFTWNSSSNTPIFLMNMIHSEQQTAWNSLSCLHQQKAQIITSGIRVEEREDYLQTTTRWNWFLEEVVEDKEWLAFRFVK